MATKHNTWEAVTAIDRIQPSIRPTSAAKIKASKVQFAFYTSMEDASWLLASSSPCELCQNLTQQSTKMTERGTLQLPALSGT